MNTEPLFSTVKEIAERGPENFPTQFIPHCHLVYSSPATLQYNSPGAFGFGVKRAGLLLPESVMLLVAPGCCGRNSAIVGSRAGYSDHMYYLQMDETDLVTGRHLSKIPEAVCEICETANPRPKAVLICITCVDALLGTDLERVSRKAEKACGVHVVPCYMYAITREGKKPPMVAIRQALYSLLKPAERRESAVNLLGNFSPLESDCELPTLLRHIGFKKVNQISACKTFEEYMKMGNASFNLVLNPESRFAAEDLRKRLGLPYCELTRLYQLDKIKKQYGLFGAALGVNLDDHIYYEKTSCVLEQFVKKYKGLNFAVGQMINANPFELSLALVKYGMKVSYIFANFSVDDFSYIKVLSELSPDTRVYSSLSPSMINFERNESGVDVTLGMDAGYYIPQARNVAWNRELQPFGYSGLESILGEIDSAMSKPDSGLLLSQPSEMGGFI